MIGNVGLLCTCIHMLFANDALSELFTKIFKYCNNPTRFSTEPFSRNTNIPTKCVIREPFYNAHCPNVLASRDVGFSFDPIE